MNFWEWNTIKSNTLKKIVIKNSVLLNDLIKDKVVNKNHNSNNHPSPTCTVFGGIFKDSFKIELNVYYIYEHGIGVCGGKETRKCEI